MAMITCDECKGEVSSKAKACPKCGAKVPRTKWWLWIPLGLICLFFVAVAFDNPSPEQQAKRKARSAIEYCWEDHKLKSRDPGAQRFVAGVCERLEREFYETYKVKP